MQIAMLLLLTIGFLVTIYDAMWDMWFQKEGVGFEITITYPLTGNCILKASVPMVARDTSHAEALAP